MLIFLGSCKQTQDRQDSNGIQNGKYAGTSTKTEKDTKSTQKSSKKIISDLEKHKLNGKVKSIRVYAYEAVQNFEKLSDKNKKREFCINKDTYFRNLFLFADLDDFLNAYIKFNENGNIIKRKKFLFNGGTIIERFDINGNIIEKTRFFSTESSTRKEIYKYDKKGNLIETISLNPDSSYSVKVTCKYDEKRNLIEKASLNPDGSYSNKKTYRYDEYGNLNEESYKEYPQEEGDHKVIYEYDKSGNLIEKTIHGSDGRPHKLTYEYNKTGDVIEENWHYIDVKPYEMNYKKTTKYDENRKLIESSSFNSKGECTGKLTCKYDEHGNIIERINIKDGRIVTKTTSKYNDSGDKVRQSIYYSEKSRYKDKSQKRIYEYDTKGNMIEKYLYNYNDSLIKKGIYKYIKFDQQQNWTKVIINGNDSSEQFIMEREIEYH